MFHPLFWFLNIEDILESRSFIVTSFTIWTKTNTVAYVVQVHFGILEVSMNKNIWMNHTEPYQFCRHKPADGILKKDRAVAVVDGWRFFVAKTM